MRAVSWSLGLLATLPLQGQSDLWLRRSTVGPAARYAHAQVWDGATGRVVLFGGWTGSSCVDTMAAWDGSSWSNLASVVRPGARRDHSLTADALGPALVLFGGDDGAGNSLGETWIWNGSWQPVNPPTAPSARAGHAAARHAGTQQLLVFGGQASPVGPWFGDTWAWDGRHWNPLAVPGPSPRAGAATAYDSHRDRIVLFGGWSGQAHLADTWEWDGQSWLRIQTSAGPSPRSGNPAMCFDPTRSAVVMFGGIGPRGAMSDTWAWDGRQWTLLSPNQSPVALYGAQLSYDPVRREGVLFGGRTAFPGGRLLGDTWASKAAGYWVYRASCAGSAGTPTLRAGSPRVGRAWSLSVSNLRPFTQGVLFFALSDQLLGLNRLPLDLAAFGAPGCYVNVNTDPAAGTTSQMVPSDVGGSVRIQVGIPVSPALIGFTFFNQYASFDAPAARSLRLTTTNAGRGVVGL